MRHTGKKMSHQLSERLAFLGIMGPMWGPMNSNPSIPQCCNVWGVWGGLPWCREIPVSRTANTFNQCNFFLSERNRYRNLVILNQIWLVIIICDGTNWTEFYLKPNQSKKCICNRNFIELNKTQNWFSLAFPQARKVSWLWATADSFDESNLRNLIYRTFCPIVWYRTDISNFLSDNFLI